MVQERWAADGGARAWGALYGREQAGDVTATAVLDQGAAYIEAWLEYAPIQYDAFTRDALGRLVLITPMPPRTGKTPVYWLHPYGYTSAMGAEEWGTADAAWVDLTAAELHGDLVAHDRLVVGAQWEAANAALTAGSPL